MGVPGNRYTGPLRIAAAHPCGMKCLAVHVVSPWDRADPRRQDGCGVTPAPPAPVLLGGAIARERPLEASRVG
jgi:hypothetical protein